MEWLTLQDYIPQSNDIVVYLEEDKEIEWRYGDCGLDRCRCSLRERKFRVLRDKD